LLFTLLTLLVPALSGVRSTAAWVVYVFFALLYSLWTLRLSSIFARDRRLGYVLCLTDVAVLLPLLVWDSGRCVRARVVIVYGAGLGLSYVIDRGQTRHCAVAPVSLAVHRRKAGRSVRMSTPEMMLEHALRTRLCLFSSEGVRFGLVILRIVRFEEAVTYYGSDAAGRVLSAVGRRGLRQLGPDAHASLSGRMAFLFRDRTRLQAPRTPQLRESEPYDVEGMAMRLARKTCEHLIEGHRGECVGGWASAPVDGLTAEDLLAAAESGTRSTEAFSRVSGPRVAAQVVPTSGAARRMVAAVGEEARTAVG
jgi:hypothetical protein